MEVRKDSELLGASQSLDIRGMLEQESEAYRNADAPNMASIYVVKKVCADLPMKLDLRSQWASGHFKRINGGVGKRLSPDAERFVGPFKDGDHQARARSTGHALHRRDAVCYHDCIASNILGLGYDTW